MTWIPDDLVKECQQGKCRRKFAKVCQLFADGAGSAFFFFFHATKQCAKSCYEGILERSAKNVKK